MQRQLFSLIALRDSGTLNRLYPPANGRFLASAASRAGKLVGWAVVLDSQMSGHKQFGNMRVGSIVDCLAEPEDAAAVSITAVVFSPERRGPHCEQSGKFGMGKGIPGCRLHAGALKLHSGTVTHAGGTT